MRPVDRADRGLTLTVRDPIKDPALDAPFGPLRPRG
jgi:hypothetical protein